jgi:hypothetical protein
VKSARTNVRGPLTVLQDRDKFDKLLASAIKKMHLFSFVFFFLIFWSNQFFETVCKQTKCQLRWQCQQLRQALYRPVDIKLLRHHERIQKDLLVQNQYPRIKCEEFCISFVLTWANHLALFSSHTNREARNYNKTINKDLDANFAPIYCPNGRIHFNFPKTQREFFKFSGHLLI